MFRGREAVTVTWSVKSALGVNLKDVCDNHIF